MAELPPRARILAEYFASIVLDATSNLDDPPTVRCRRRPPRQRCPGIVMSYPSAEEDDRSIGTVRCATTTASSAAGRARSGMASRTDPSCHESRAAQEELRVLTQCKPENRSSGLISFFALSFRNPGSHHDFRRNRPSLYICPPAPCGVAAAAGKESSKKASASPATPGNCETKDTLPVCAPG